VEALERIAATTIHSNYAFFRKAQKQWVRGTFNLFTVFFRGQDLPNGQVADTTYLFLHPLDVESLNSFYVKPLDYAYLRQLANPLTQRLYEVLGLRFRGLRNSAYTRYEYEHLCQTLPITPQRSLKDAKKVLAPHHDRLYKTGFLAKVEWHARQSVKPWEVFYWPGSKAQEEMQRAREFPQPQFSLTDSDGEEESFQIQDLLDQIRDEIQDPRWEQSLPFYRRAIQDLGSDHVYARLAETRGASREGKIRKSKAGVSANLLSDIPQPRDGMGVMRGVGRISAWEANGWHKPTAVNPSITSASSRAGGTHVAWAMSWTTRPHPTRHGATSPSGQRSTPWCARAWDGSRHRAPASPGAARLSPPPASWRPA
jgi:hypothetical protein